MVVHGTHMGGWFRSHHAEPAVKEAAISSISAREYVVATVRIITGFLFLWAFLDKTFGLGYSTQGSHAWINGGSPTKGFLSGLNAGPFVSTFHGWAGQGWADWLFMIGLAGIGVALILGIGVRFAAVAGVILVAFMWVAVWPLAQHTSDGSLTGSANPLVDEHVMDALALMTVGVFGAGSRLGLGSLWAKLPFIRDHRALI